jgi:hypothetical protein
MNIKFDFELNSENDNKKLSPILIGLLEEIRGYISQRLAVLDDTMKKQEAYFGSYTLINIVTSPILHIAFVNYSPSLLKKLEPIITEDDYKYLNLRLSNIADSFLN